jgi:hypothetical protein
MKRPQDTMELSERQKKEKELQEERERIEREYGYLEDYYEELDLKEQKVRF